MDANQQVAIVFCQEVSDDVHKPNGIPFGRSKDAFLLKLVDRPFLQHVVEWICEIGIKKIYVFNSADAIGVRALLGQGERWGCSIEHIVMQSPQHARQKMTALGLADTTQLLLVNAHVLLPDAPLLKQVAKEQTSNPSATNAMKDHLALFYGRDERQVAALLTTHACAAQQDNMADLQAWDQESVLSAQRYQSEHRALSCLSGSALLEAQEQALTDQIALLNSGFEIEPGVWMSRNVVMHPTVQIVAPVFLGANCRIDAGCQIGPNVALADSTRIARGVTMHHCAVSEATWVGEDLHCEQLFIEHDTIWNAKLRVSLNIRDAFLLSPMLPQRNLRAWLAHVIAAFCGRMSALALWGPLFVFSQLLNACCKPRLLKALDAGNFARHGSSSSSKGESDTELVYEKLRHASWADQQTQGHDGGVGQASSLLSQLPVRQRRSPRSVWQHASSWGHFANWVCLGLGHVALGHWSWVGVQVRSPEQFMALDEEWRAALMGVKPGLLAIGRIEFGRDAQSWEHRLSETLFVHQPPSAWRKLGLLARYLKTMFQPQRRSE